MDPAIYHRGRASGMRAKDALRLARWMAEDRLDIDIDSPLAIQRDGFDVTIWVKSDDDMSFDDLGYGHFEDGREDYNGYYHAASPGAIPNANRDSRSPGNGARFYVPANDRADIVAYYHKAGASKSVALDMARADEADEMERLSSYGPMVVQMRVTASRQGIALGHASCGGIELAWSDVTRSDGTEYLSEVADDLIPEAIAEAEEALERLIA